ncbi:MAG: hypothetical protein HOW73_39040 [Polyangiaceae bacterium]|nr:hypothetical protein [Polyangiaceae bacterium]
MLVFFCAVAFMAVLYPFRRMGLQETGSLFKAASGLDYLWFIGVRATALTALFAGPAAVAVHEIMPSVEAARGRRFRAVVKVPLFPWAKWTLGLPFLLLWNACATHERYLVGSNWQAGMKWYELILVPILALVVLGRRKIVQVDPDGTRLRRWYGLSSSVIRYAQAFGGELHLHTARRREIVVLHGFRKAARARRAAWLAERINERGPVPVRELIPPASVSLDFRMSARPISEGVRVREIPRYRLGPGDEIAVEETSAVEQQLNLEQQARRRQA